MPPTSHRPKLSLNSEQQEILEQTSRSRKLPQREVQRAKVFLSFARGESISAIERIVGMSRVSIYKWIDRALAFGIEEAMHDKYHRPKEPLKCKIKIHPFPKNPPRLSLFRWMKNREFKPLATQFQI